MPKTKGDWYFILFVIMVIVDIVLNEIGLGVITLILLLPTVLLMQKVLDREKPG